MKYLFISAIIMSNPMSHYIIDGELCQRYIVRTINTHEIVNTYILEGEYHPYGDTVNIQHSMIKPLKYSLK